MPKNCWPSIDGPLYTLGLLIFCNLMHAFNWYRHKSIFNSFDILLVLLFVLFFQLNLKIVRTKICASIWFRDEKKCIEWWKCLNAKSWHVFRIFVFQCDFRIILFSFPFQSLYRSNEKKASFLSEKKTKQQQRKKNPRLENLNCWKLRSE